MARFKTKKPAKSAKVYNKIDMSLGKVLCMNLYLYIYDLYRNIIKQCLYSCKYGLSCVKGFLVLSEK